MIRRLLSLTEPAVIAHRGGSKLRPENTLAAFDHAASLGVDGLECDVHLSRDGEPVVIHDPTLDRTTDASGPVSALTADELARVDAGYRFGEADGFPHRGRGIGVPRLSTLLRRHADLPLVVELKGAGIDIVSPVLEVIRDAGAEGRVLFGGFELAVMREARRLAPHIPTSASRDELKSALIRSRFRLGPRRSGFVALQVPYRFRGNRILLSPLVRAARRRGFPVHAWIVDEEAEMREILKWGVTGIISDRPDIALSVVRALGLGV